MRRILAVCVVVLVACSSGSSKPAATSASSTSTASAAKVGDTVNADKGTVQVISFASAPGSEMPQIRKVDTGRVFFIAEVRVCGANANPLAWKIRSKTDLGGTTELGTVNEQIQGNELKAGECSRGRIGFSLPQGERPAVLLYGLLSTEARITVG